LRARAEAALADAGTLASIARTALEASIAAWAVQLERTYGPLAAELDRRVAERFFPRRTPGGDADTPVEPGDHEPPSQA
jgi:hypothetical protein